MPWPISWIVSWAIGVRRHSVYRMAAAGSPSSEPKLPLPSTSVARIMKGWAIRTSAS